MSSRTAPPPSTRVRRAPRRDRHARPVTHAPGGGEVARHRRAGGPEDSALYACGCGESFRAAVSASVSCPRCDARQAW